MEPDPRYGDPNFVEFIQRILFYAEHGVQVRTIQSKFPHMSLVHLRHILKIHGVKEKFGEQYYPYDTYFATLSRKEIDLLGATVFRAVNRPVTYEEHLKKAKIDIRKYKINSNGNWMKKVLAEPKERKKRFE